LESGLIGGCSEGSEEVADLLLAGIDDLAGGSLIDGGGHILTQLLEATTQLFQKGICRQGRFGRHGLLLGGKANQQTRPACSAERSSQRRRSRKICHTPGIQQR
jgi:hypothetical protein